MLRKLIAHLILFLVLISCDENSSKSFKNNSHIEDNEVIESPVESEDENSDELKDGTYCADVEYYNPNTGTRNTYNLDVEVENGDLTEIHWPNGGWLDETHFQTTDISSGECTFRSDRGYRYTVTLEDYGGCGYTDANRIRSDVNSDVEETTCPKCGQEKSSYEEYCDDCKRKIEHTCPKCGGYRSNPYDEYCDYCKSELENESH